MIGTPIHNAANPAATSEVERDLRPNRMMVARDHHLNRPGSYLRRSDERAEAHGGGEGKALGLQHR